MEGPKASTTIFHVSSPRARTPVRDFVRIDHMASPRKRSPSASVDVAAGDATRESDVVVEGMIINCSGGL